MHFKCNSTQLYEHFEEPAQWLVIKAKITCEAKSNHYQQGCSL